jgi:tripartite motif-containing protein 9/67
MTSGRHYWEVKIDKYADEEDLFLGVARKTVNLSQAPQDSNQFWGYMPIW